MEPISRVVRDSSGNERVLLDLADFQALLDAASAVEHGLPEVAPLIRRLSEILDVPDDQDVVDLDQFLADYDAAHGPR